MTEPVELGPQTTRSVFRMATWLLGAILLAAVVVVVCRQYVFVERLQTRTLENLVAQFQSGGLKVGPLEPLADKAGAERAARVDVEGSPVELFHFNVENRQQLERLREVRASRQLEVDGKEVPVLVNDAFVMAGSQDNPHRDLLEREFRGFGDFEGIDEQKKLNQ